MRPAIRIPSPGLIGGAVARALDRERLWFVISLLVRLLLIGLMIATLIQQQRHINRLKEQNRLLQQVIYFMVPVPEIEERL